MWNFTGVLDPGYAGDLSPKPEVSDAKRCGHLNTVVLVTFVAENGVPSSASA
jgi:hypothetical protein